MHCCLAFDSDFAVCQHGGLRWRGMRILVAEDNEELAQLLCEGLQAAGYDADRLSSASETRSALSTVRYAAMVLDLGLPDGDGLTLVRELRARRDPLPILVLTARGGLN